MDNLRLTIFINENLNKGIDYDKAYGNQCVDVFRQYCQDVLKIEHTGSVKGARELYEKYEQLPLEQKYFNRLNSDAKPVYGDIAVWGGTSGNPYGHVAIVLNETEDGLVVMEQDGFVAGDKAHLKVRSKMFLLGYLRSK